jgi:hypothetical protein
MFCFSGFREAKTLAPQGAIPFKIRWQRSSNVSFGALLLGRRRATRVKVPERSTDSF